MSSLQVGIVGLPNVGKSTLFNALTKQAAKAQNVPFTTIEPNIGVVAVPDERLDKLTKIAESVKITPTIIEFVDIAGLVKNAHKGEGLGNQFLANIREVDAIAHVVRFFDDPGITHVDNNIDPERDIETINTELILTDLGTVEKMRSNSEKKAKGEDKEAKALLSVLVKLEKHLGDGYPARTLVLEEDEMILKKQVSLLTDKPVLYIANINEEQINTPPENLKKVTEEYKDVMPISVKIEQELVELPQDERLEFLAEYNLEQTGLDRLIQASYKLLNLITFFTSGPTESRAWTVSAGSRAPQAAGQVHSDMEHGFIRAETVSYEDLANAESYANARAQGKVRDEGKEYMVVDGDVMLFKFSN
jgi:ribosome-binding ATPase